MSQEKDKTRNRHLKSIEKSVREIFDKAEAREKAGKEPFHAGCGKRTEKGKGDEGKRGRG